jgi:predicted N-formylglutamate amidohydrolase
MSEARRPAAVTVSNEAGASPYLLICEHASHWLPPEYAGLGLKSDDLLRHIAWDIGALQVAQQVAATLDAPVIAAGASRLLIDLNRPTQSPTSIPTLSEATPIPGNLHVSDAERQHRIATWFDPFHARVAGVLDRRLAAGKPTILIAIHSFTPVFLGVARPLNAGVLYRRSHDFGGLLVETLGGIAGGIAHNEPYQIDDASDYAIPVHGEARGLEAVLVELRQDLIAASDGVGAWAARLSAALQACLTQRGPTDRHG